MFTGLIQTLATIQSIVPVQSDNPKEGMTVTLTAQHIASPLKQGESIALNGVCTTVTKLNNTTFSVELSPETLEVTTFLALQPSQVVNMERCLTLADPLGGHIVSGHIDSKAVCIDKQQDGNCWRYDFRLMTPEHASLLIPKGSIAIDGISLTLNTVQNHQFSVAIIPHTLEHTNLQHIKPDTLVNIECDMMGKYVQRYMQHYSASLSENRTETHAHDRVPEAFFPNKMGNSTIHTGAWFNLEKPEATD